MSRFVISPEARVDLDEIWDYVAVTNENPAAAVRLRFRRPVASTGPRNRKRRSVPSTRYSTVTDFARFRGRSTLQPRSSAT